MHLNPKTKESGLLQKHNNKFCLEFELDVDGDLSLSNVNLLFLHLNETKGDILLKVC